MPSLLVFRQGICGALLQWAASGSITAKERALMRNVLDDIRHYEDSWAQDLRRDVPRRLLAQLELMRAPKEVASREGRWLTREQRAQIRKSRYVGLRQAFATAHQGELSASLSQKAQPFSLPGDGPRTQRGTL